MTTSATLLDDKKTWIYAFIILLLVSLWMLAMDLLKMSFLASDFVVIVVYLPTILAGIIAAYVTLKPGRDSRDLSE